MSNRRHVRPIAGSGLGRRQFLGRAGLVLGGVALAPSLLAACSSDSGGGSSSSGGGGSDPKRLNISNWTSYMSQDALQKFEQESGIKVTYDEDINDNNEYYAKISPNLSKGKGIGRDGIALTDWMCNRLINQVPNAPWVQKLDAAAIPNKSNLRAALASPSFDPTRTYTLPWQTGVAGIAYNKAKTGKDILTLDDFLAVNGTVTVLSEMRDTVGLFMMADGKDITNPSYAAAQPAFDRLEKALNDGSIDGVNGNEYVSDLGSGNLAAAFAWSGDVAQISLDNPNVKFVVPESGGTLWADNFMIPLGSEKVKQASEYINFFYDPVNAALLTAEVQYISPVNGVAEELTKMGGDAAKLVDNPLVNPNDEFLQTVHIFGKLSDKEEEQFDKRFSQIIGAG